MCDTAAVAAVQSCAFSSVCFFYFFLHPVGSQWSLTLTVTLTTAEILYKSPIKYRKPPNTHRNTQIIFLPTPTSEGKGFVNCRVEMCVSEMLKVCVSIISSVRMMHHVKATDRLKNFGARWLDPYWFSPSLSLSLPPDLLNGAQEKCELPSLDGFPHCEGKLKVNHSYEHTKRQPLLASPSVSLSHILISVYLFI